MARAVTPRQAWLALVTVLALAALLAGITLAISGAGNGDGSAPPDTLAPQATGAVGDSLPTETDAAAPATTSEEPVPTVSEGVAPPGVADGDRLRICEQEAAVAAGELFADYPRRLEYDETGNVSATIILNRPAGTPVESPAAGSDRSIEVFEGTSCEIRATLSSTDFVIEPTGAQSRTFLPALDDDGFEETPNAEWVWAVRSTNPGPDRMLYLKVEPIYVIDGRELPGEVAQLPLAIDVADAPDDRSIMERANDAVKSLLTHPLFLLLVPSGGAAWLYARIRLRRKPPTPPTNE